MTFSPPHSSSFRIWTLYKDNLSSMVYSIHTDIKKPIFTILSPMVVSFNLFQSLQDGYRIPKQLSNDSLLSSKSSTQLLEVAIYVFSSTPLESIELYGSMSVSMLYRYVNSVFVDSFDLDADQRSPKLYSHVLQDTPDNRSFFETLPSPYTLTVRITDTNKKESEQSIHLANTHCTNVRIEQKPSLQKVIMRTNWEVVAQSMFIPYTILMVAFFLASFLYSLNLSQSLSLPPYHFLSTSIYDSLHDYFSTYPSFIQWFLTRYVMVFTDPIFLVFSLLFFISFYFFPHLAIQANVCPIFLFLLHSQNDTYLQLLLGYYNTTTKQFYRSLDCIVILCLQCALDSFFLFVYFFLFTPPSILSGLQNHFLIALCYLLQFIFLIFIFIFFALSKVQSKSDNKLYMVLASTKHCLKYIFLVISLIYMIWG